MKKLGFSIVFKWGLRYILYCKVGANKEGADSTSCSRLVEPAGNSLIESKITLSRESTISSSLCLFV